MLRAIVGASVGVLLFCGLMEVLFRLLPVATATMSGYYIDPSILTYPPAHEWQVATGWDLRNAQRLRANNFGFVSDHDFVAGTRAIAMVGDSYVEASMLPAGSRPAAQLESELKGARQVYALGGPGSSLLDYVERIRFASMQLGTRDFVVLVEPGDVRQALCGSGNVHGPCLDRETLQPRVEIQPEASRAKELFRHSALAQYVVSQLKLDIAQFWKRLLTGSLPEPSAASGTVDQSPPPNSTFDLRATDAVLDTFLTRLDGLGSDLRVLFVVDGRRSKTAKLDPVVARERARLVERLRVAGRGVLDAEPLYAAHEAVSARLLNVGPYDGHLNALGVSIVMRAVAAELQ